jgi:hypothetical protein
MKRALGSRTAWRAGVAGLALLALGAGDGSGSGGSLADLDDEARQAEMRRLSPEERFALLEGTSTAELVKIGKTAARALETYGAKLIKQERIDGELQDPQTAQIWVKSSPLALRVEFIEGSSKGRRLLYNAALRSDQLRAKESGFLGIAGAVWIGVDSSLTRRDSNHPITDIGFSALMDLIAKDFTAAAAAGGHARANEGADADGLYCILFTAPSGAAGLYATSARLCIDPVLGLPLRTEITDPEGLLERYVYREVKPRLSLPADHFTPEGAGL